MSETLRFFDSDGNGTGVDEPFENILGRIFIYDVNSLKASFEDKELQPRS